MFMSKLKKTQEFLQEQYLDVALIMDPAAIRLISGYSTEPHERIAALFVFPSSDPILFVPSLEEKMAREVVETENSHYTVISYADQEDPWQVLSDYLKAINNSLKRWALEKNYITIERLEALQAHFLQADFSHNLSPFINHLRLQKGVKEIELLKIAGDYADLAISIGVNALKEGVSELEVVALIEYEMKKRGILSMSFDTMVLFGDHAADPHGIPGQRTLGQNEFVLFDLGVFYQGYASDITRTVFFGQKMSPEQIQIHEVVQKAHDLALAAVKPGVKAQELDRIARNYISEQGYGEFFIHRLGHGIGQSCHEFPSIVEGNQMELIPGMCFSIEPGIYIPGKIGVRIEDCVVVTENGCELFTHAPCYID